MDNNGIPLAVKKAAWELYIGKEIKESSCMCCNRESISIGNFHCGFIVSEESGGKPSIENLRPICTLCKSKNWDKIQIGAKIKTKSHQEILLGIIYERYSATFKCTSIRRNVWYEFKQHRWIRVEGSYTLRSKISDEIPQELTNFVKQLYMESMEHRGMESDMLQARAGELANIIVKISNPNFNKKLLAICTAKFFDSTFEGKLDENPFLLGFDNGVYDLKGNCFRKGAPEDMVSLSVGYDYVAYCMDDPIIKDIISFFEGIQERDNMREYLLTLISSYLIGITKEQQFNMWTGSDPESRSVTLDLIRCTFGEYYGILPVTVLTRRRSYSASSVPELADKKGKRLLVIRDIDNASKINFSLMKELVGGDYIVCKPLYRDPYMYKPQLKAIFVSYNVPTIPPHDGGTLRRSRVYKWEPKYVNDFELSKNVSKYKQGFIWLLLNVYYPKYATDGIIEPDGIKLNFIADNCT
jgi:hypothetical protein